ncbi:hypothetical protein AVEN_163501-1 [Araneus ventricosus]|uniref:Uncharacterized protein n=1 Tax=Araneus ventricosus TaxID=182803 RepID=A0A4Y2BSM3_ARAVE|nr:hypothetical protein AVEN_163501-1 [Araneus ventricosus]
MWQTKESFFFVPKKYVDCAKKYFNGGTTIVFDGYFEDAAKSRNSVECTRRTKKHIAGYFMLDESMSATTSQEKFLSNANSKQRVINMLRVKFKKDFVVKQAEENVGYLIIRNTLETEKSHNVLSLLVKTSTSWL